MNESDDEQLLNESGGKTETDNLYHQDDDGHDEGLSNLLQSMFRLDCMTEELLRSIRNDDFSLLSMEPETTSSSISDEIIVIPRYDDQPADDNDDGLFEELGRLGAIVSTLQKDLEDKSNDDERVTLETCGEGLMPAFIERHEIYGPAMKGGHFNKLLLLLIIVLWIVLPVLAIHIKVEMLTEEGSKVFLPLFPVSGPILWKLNTHAIISTNVCQ